MMRSLAIPVLLALLLGGSLLRAQDTTRSVYIGGHAGYETGVQSTRFPIFSPSAECGEFTGGRSASLSIGLIAIDPAFFSRHFGGALTLDWTRTDGLFTATPQDPLYFPSGTIDHQYHFHSGWRTLRLGLLFYHQLTGALGLSYGAELGYRYGAGFTQSDTIVGNTELRFLNGRSEEAMTPEKLTAMPAALGLVASGHIRLPLSSRVTLLPTITVRADLLSAVRERNWQTYGVMAGGTLLFDIGHHPDSAGPPPPAIASAPEILSPPLSPIPVAQPRNQHLDASIDLYGIDEENHRLPAVTIRVYEVVYRRRSGMLGSVYFDRRSAEPPARYSRLTREEAAGFSIDSLASLGAVQLHHQSLNILGWRLRENRSATVVLTGLASMDEPGRLGRERAEGIRNYLAATWSIDTERIGITEKSAAISRSAERTPDGRSENRRVEIVTGSPEIMSPVVLERKARDFDPPLIAIDPTFKADAGVRRWDIALIRDGDTVGHYSSTDTGDPASNVDWQITSDGAGVLQTLLIAQLRVEDSLGTTVTTTAQVPLMIERNIRVVDRSEALDSNRERVTYTLLPFSYNSAELSERNDGVLKEASATIRSGARITITGYADRTGTGAANLDLSRSRAERVARRLAALLKSLGIRDTEITSVGAGADTGRYSNDLPEGRTLSRDVDITIEQVLPKGIARQS